MASRASRPASRGLALVCGVLCGGLAGCAGTPPLATTPPFIDLPVRWQDTPLARASPLAEWWRRFDDAPLSSLVDNALQANPSLQAARAAVRQARAVRDAADGGLFPSLNSSVSVRRNTLDQQSTDAASAGLDASWEPDVFGRLRGAVQAADASLNASSASLGDGQVAVAAEVALAYLALRSAQERQLIARNNLANQLDTLQLADWRLQAGLVSTLETEQARAVLEQTRASIPALQTSIAQNAHALAILTGRTPDALLSALSTLLPVPQPTEDIALSFPAETLRQRADVRAAEFQILAAAARLSQADAARLPRFTLGGSIGLNALSLAGLAGAGTGATVVRSLLASVSLPLFSGGALQAQVRAQQAGLDQAQADYKARVLDALRDVEDALVALRGDRLRLASLRLAAASAASAAQLANLRFQSGLVDFQTVLDTQRTQLSTQDSVASAWATVSADHVRLYQALGGGWQSDLKSSEL